MIRTAHANDVDAILQIEAGAFSYQENLARCRSERARIAEHIHEWLVLPVDEKIVGAVHVTPQWYQIGHARVLNGEVGAVAIDPKAHGQGLGTRMMHETVAWMIAQGYALSRLGGLGRFYSRFGYQRFPRRYLEINVGGTGYPGNANAVEGEITLPAADIRPVIPYEPERHGVACMQLLNDFNREYAGAPAPGDTMPSARAGGFVVTEDDTVIGYLCTETLPRDHTEFEARVIIRNLAYQRDTPHALQNLIAHVVNSSLAREITRLTARVPFDPRIVSAMSALPLRFHLIESYGGLGTNMLRILNLPVLLEQLAPEMERRLAAFPARWQGALGIEVDGVQVVLEIDGTSLRLADRAPTLRATIPPAQMLALVLGLHSFADIEPLVCLTPPPGIIERALLHALFASQQVYSGHWG